MAETIISITERLLAEVPWNNTIQLKVHTHMTLKNLLQSNLTTLTN